MKILIKAKGFLTSPSKAFDVEKATTLGSAFKYMLVLFLVTSILSGIVAPLTTPLLGGLTATSFIMVFISTYIGGIIGCVILGLWLHLWVYLLGARKGLEQTLKTVFYGETPSYLLGWIPFVGVIFGIWTLVLEWIGLKRLQVMSGGRAAGAIIIAIVIPAIILIVLGILAGWAILYALEYEL